MGKRLDDALRIRDAAIAKISADGQFEEVARANPMIIWKGDGISMGYRTPFQKLPLVPVTTLREAALHGLVIPETLPFGLDIWDTKGQGKVLNMEPADNGKVELRAFHRGEWEKTILGWIEESDLAQKPSA